MINLNESAGADLPRFRFDGVGDLRARIAESLGGVRALSRAQVERLLASAKKLERATRHKANPNIPALGDRATLLATGILTNDLPEL